MIKDVGSFLETTAKVATHAVILRFPDLSQEWFLKRIRPRFDELMTCSVRGSGCGAVRERTNRPPVGAGLQGESQMGGLLARSKYVWVLGKSRHLYRVENETGGDPREPLPLPGLAAVQEKHNWSGEVIPRSLGIQSSTERNALSDRSMGDARRP